ncbi:acyl-CoA carboxylase epsilon subunit [Streptomyces sp. NPDC127110]|uniref:acyl-CoA carboxylase epsilon subunit n=1 Tax=Streptomyces sp. NPDC127110 TaxID=3345362 RepID=UPI00362B0AFB
MSAAEPQIRITRGVPDPVEVAALTAVLLALGAARGDADAGPGATTAPAPWSRDGSGPGAAGSWSGRGLPAWRANL